MNEMMAHTLPALVTQHYNPGVLQSVLMLVPTGLLFIRQVLQKYHGHGKLMVIESLIFGGPIGHGICLLLPLKLLSTGIVDMVGVSLLLVGLQTAIISAASYRGASLKLATA